MSVHAKVAPASDGVAGRGFSSAPISRRWRWWSGCTGCCSTSSRTSSSGIGIIDINSVQALLLFNIGDNEVTAGELKTRGYYQGSNVSYNLKKLVECGYMHHQRCEVDRRAVRVRLTEKGPQHPHDHRRTVPAPRDRHPEPRGARQHAARRTSTPACGGWSTTGPTRSAISTEVHCEDAGDRDDRAGGVAIMLGPRILPRTASRRLPKPRKS